jgi:hypothetical protein
MLTAKDIGLGVHGVAAIVDSARIGVQRSEGGLVNEIVPVAIETRRVAVVDANEQGLERLLAESGKHQP